MAGAAVLAGCEELTARCTDPRQRLCSLTYPQHCEGLLISGSKHQILSDISNAEFCSFLCLDISIPSVERCHSHLPASLHMSASGGEAWCLKCVCV